MLQIWLIRPGCTDYDQQERIQGNLDIPLSEKGRMEVAAVVEQLRNQAVRVIYAPASQPAEETARAIADALDLRLRKLDRLENLDLGLWQGMLVEDVRHKQPKVYRQWQEQPETVCPPQGEMLGEADERVRAAMIKVLRRHKEGAIALVVPEPLLSLVRRFISHAGLGDLWRPRNGHGCWEVLEVAPEAVLAPSS